MPEPNRPVEPTYAYHSLDMWRRAGTRRVEFWCLSCSHWHAVAIDTLIAKAGPGTSLVMLARRATCSRCKRRGCHVQPEPPPAPGTPDYRLWLREEMERCQAFLSHGRGQL